jgi:hypothetical protein
VTFGEVCAPSAKGAVKTNALFPELPARFAADPVYQKMKAEGKSNAGYPVYARPVKYLYHTLTNLLYTDTRALLALNGQTYVRTVVKPRRR